MNRGALASIRTIIWQRRQTPQAVSLSTTQLDNTLSRTFASWSSSSQEDRPAWSEEWKSLGLGAQLMDSPRFPKNLMFVQVGFGVDQHGKDDATKASTRAVRNAIEFNSIPGVIDHIPGGRKEMLIHVKLGVPGSPMHPVDVLQVAKVFPYGKLLPIDVVPGGLEFSTGRVVEELGDSHDRAICVAACVSIGYGTPEDDGNDHLHKTYNTRDGF